MDVRFCNFMRSIPEFQSLDRDPMAACEKMAGMIVAWLVEESKDAIHLLSNRPGSMRRTAAYFMMATMRELGDARRRVRDRTSQWLWMRGIEHLGQVARSRECAHPEERAMYRLLARQFHRQFGVTLDPLPHGWQDEAPLRYTTSTGSELLAPRSFREAERMAQ